MPRQTGVFISYTAVDERWAEWIAWQVERVGERATFQKWDIRPGANFVLEMQAAASKAERTIAVLSRAYLASAYASTEWAAAFAEDATGKQRKLIPVRIEDCKPTGLLRTIVYIDLFAKDEGAARTALLQGLRGGRAKPTRQPSWPGGATAATKASPAFPGNAPRKAAREKTLETEPAPRIRARPVASSKLTDEQLLRKIASKRIIDVDTLDLTPALAKLFPDSAEILRFVVEAESLIKRIDPKVDRFAGVFGPENLAKEAGALQMWSRILMEAPLKGPRALGAILIRAKRARGVKVPEIDKTLKTLARGT